MKFSFLLCTALFPLCAMAEVTDSTTTQHHILKEVVVNGFKQDNISKTPMSVSVAGSQFINHNELNGLRDVSSVFQIFLQQIMVHDKIHLSTLEVLVLKQMPLLLDYMLMECPILNGQLLIQIQQESTEQKFYADHKVHYMDEILQADLSIFIPIRHQNIKTLQPN